MAALQLATLGPARFAACRGHSCSRAQHTAAVVRHQDVTHARTSKSQSKATKLRASNQQVAALSHLSCSFASGCCARHVWSCRDKSRLKLAAPCGAAGCCAATTPAVYTRPGKTGSKNASLFFAARRGCAQYGLFHDTLARDLPPHQPKVTVLREPCSRARSLLGHWREYFGPTHPVQRVRSMDDFAAFLGANWGAITATPWPELDPLRAHYIVGWPQSWYVDGCTRVICFSRLDRQLRGYCGQTPPPAPQPPPPRRNRTAIDGDTGWCGAVRRLYAEDAALHDAYCVAA